LQRQSSWWERGLIYQIYPRSFADAGGDGVGDLPGIISRLDYLEWIGVDAVWLSPFYPSPMADFGYDISDHCDVDPMFGGLSDFDELLEKAHERGIRVIVDLVPNHTSDEHRWFQESRSSRDNPNRDWYVWRDPVPGGGPPNNWESIFGGGGAWEWDEHTGQHYLHTFHIKQPDLNWENPEVRRAMYDVMRFWLDRGVAGFRIDALPPVAKDPELRNDPQNPDWTPNSPPSERLLRVNSEDAPEIIEVVREMRAVTDEYDGERVLIGEAYLPLDRLMEYYGAETGFKMDGLQLPFNFGLLLVPEWGTQEVESVIERYEDALPGGAWPNWVLGNHDNPRVASRIGFAQVRNAQMLLLTLRGTPTCYYGDEIDMLDAEIPSELAQDPQGVNRPDYNRDPERTPMQWDASPNAGFCAKNAEPWLRIPEHETVNVQAQQDDPHSMLTLFRRLIELRRQLSALTSGSYRRLDTEDENILAYIREHEGQEVEQILVVLNFGSQPATLDLSRTGAAGETLCSTHLDRDGRVDLKQIYLRPDEGMLIAPDPSDHSTP
jgi:alpha-glucosidase